MNQALNDSRTASAAGVPSTKAASQPAELMEVQAKDLPWHCPPPGASLWNQHPRVFINLAQGEQACPYCGARYRLAAGQRVGGH